MPEEEVAGNKDNSADGGTQVEGGTTEGAEVNPQPKLIFDKFKDVTEAEKAYKESVRKITEQGQLLSEREKQVRDLEERAKLTDVLKSLADSRKAEAPKNDKEFKEYIETLASEMAEAPAEATKKLVHLANAWQLETEKKVQQYSDEKSSKLESQLAEMRDMMERMDSSYQQNKDVIDELVAGGMKLSAAKKFVGKLASGSPDMIQRPSPPASPSSVRTVRTSGEPVFISAKDKERMKAEGADDAMIAELELEYKRNYSREQEESKRVREG